MKAKTTKPQFKLTLPKFAKKRKALIADGFYSKRNAEIMRLLGTGMTQAEVAKLCGVTPARISGIYIREVERSLSMKTKRKAA